MNKMKHIALTGAFAIAAMSAASQSAFAQAASDPASNAFGVKVTVAPGCTFTKPDNFVFPELKGYKDTTSVFNSAKNNLLPSPALKTDSSVGPPATQGSNLTVTCTRGTGYTITFSGANDVNFGADGEPLPNNKKYMKSTTGDYKILYYLRPSDNLASSIGSAYNVSKTDGTKLKDSGYAVSETAVDGKPKTLSITATIDQKEWGTNPPKPGSYSDTVTIKVNF